MDCGAKHCVITHRQAVLTCPDIVTVQACAADRGSLSGKETHTCGVGAGSSARSLCCAYVRDHLPPVAEAALLSKMDCVYSAAGAIACTGAGQRSGFREGLGQGQVGLGQAMFTEGSFNLCTGIHTPRLAGAINYECMPQWCVCHCSIGRA